MPILAKSGPKVRYLPLDEIDPSPFQARQAFDAQELAGLALSIRQNGLLTPVSVRRMPSGRYQLVAGERRLRACKMAGIKRVPAILCQYDDDESAALGLLENMQRQGLNPFEQARGIRDVIARWNCTQSQAAERLGISQPALNNKLRLLSLSEEQQQLCLEKGLGERHARAVLRLPEGEPRSLALAVMARSGMNARQADEYVSRLLQEGQKSRRKVTPVIRDVRIFLNTVEKAVRTMKEAGVPAVAKRSEKEDYIEYLVRIPTSAGEKKGPPSQND